MKNVWKAMTIASALAVSLGVNLLAPGLASAALLRLTASAPKPYGGAEYEGFSFSSLRQYATDESLSSALFYSDGLDTYLGNSFDDDESSLFNNTNFFGVVGNVTVQQSFSGNFVNAGYPGTISMATGGSLTFNTNFIQTLATVCPECSDMNARLKFELGNQTNFGAIQDYATRGETGGLLNANSLSIAGHMSFYFQEGFDLASKNGQSFLLFGSDSTIDLGLLYPYGNKYGPIGSQGFDQNGDALDPFTGYLSFQKLQTGFNGADEVWATVAAPVPEPSTVVLLGVGLAGLAGIGIRRRNKK